MRAYLIVLLLCCQTLSATQAKAADAIGRLFTQPAERSTLDYLRQTRKKLPEKIALPTVDAVTEPRVIALPDAVNLQGYVKRNDGKQGTIWVNDRPLQENTGNKEVQVGKLPVEGSKVPIKLNANGKQITLKAGQVYDPEINRVREARSYAAQGDSGRIGDENTQ